MISMVRQMIITISNYHFHTGRNNNFCYQQQMFASYQFELQEILLIALVKIFTLLKVDTLTMKVINFNYSGLMCSVFTAFPNDT